MTWNLWTILLAAGSAVIVTYEIVAAVQHEPGTPTITGIVQHLSSRPAVPFFFGCLMGHFFL